MAFPEHLLQSAVTLLERCRARGLRIATAESCTGGLIAALLTEIPGSSDVVDRGFVTYSNAAKREMLGVPAELIETHGAVSEPAARAMAEGALARSEADLAIAVTGVAGPGGGTADKPVGLVWFALARSNGEGRVEQRRFGDTGRAAVRLDSVRTALGMLSDALEVSR